MPVAEIADDAVKARFQIEGRQLYSPPVNPIHNPFPTRRINDVELFERAPYPDTVYHFEVPQKDAPFFWPLTTEQLDSVKRLGEEADFKRACALSLDEVERSIALCRKCGVRAPKWMTMARELLAEDRRKRTMTVKTPEA